MKVSKTAITVRYAETDQMGIAHHSNYPIWFEAGRTDFIKKMGMPYSEIEKSGVMLPLLEMKCVYKSAARYEDELIISTHIKESNGVRLLFSYQVNKAGDNALIAEGETLHVWTDSSLKPVNIRKFSPELHELIKNSCL